MKLRWLLPLALAGPLLAQFTPPVYVPANSYTNAGTTGTTLHKLAKLSAANTVVRMATTDTDGALGICTVNCTTSGHSTIQWGGIASCAFDGATTLGHYVTISSSVAGDCADAGSTPPASGQVIGVVLSTNGSAGAYNVNLQLRGPAPAVLTAHGISAPLSCVAASASGTAYTCSTSPSFTPAAGDTVLLKADVANTGSATLAVNGATAATVKKQGGGTNLAANDFLIGQNALLTFDGANWQMQTQTGNASGGTGTVTTITLAGTANQITVTGTCTVTTTGTCTFSVPSDFRLPGTINKLTLTQPATGATVTIADGKTVTVNKTITLDGTDGVTITFPASSATVATLGLTNTFTGRQDAGGAASTAPAKVVSSDPGTCTVGDLIFNSAATAGQNLKGCTATNTFTVQGGNASSGSMILVESHAASSSAALNFTSCFSGTYDDYLLRFIQLVPATSGDDLIMQFSTDGGSTYDTGANYGWADWGWIAGAGGPGGANTGASSMTLANNNGNTTSWSTSGHEDIVAPGSSTFKFITGQFNNRNTVNGTLEGYVSSGAYFSTTAVNAFRIKFSSGNIASGTVRCYGIAH